MSIILSPIVAILIVFQLLTAALLYIPIGIFQWVISAPVSLTHEPIVTAGWQISRDFVNIFFVIALVVIAVATILRIKGYEAQKMLPQIIFAAILVNFTPVFCGIILDIANIVMNIFRAPVFDVGQLFVKNNAIINGFIKADGMWSDWGHFIASLIDPSIAIGTIGLLVAGVLFNIISFITLSVYALIFFLRIAVIWMLVILSPFALVGFFFQPFKKIFNDWWKQFFQWSIIGIPLFFFLYIAEMMLSSATSGHGICTGALTVSGNISDAISGSFMCSFLSALFPAAFLILGVFVSFQTSAMGASTITGGISKWAKNTGTNAGKALWKGTKDNAAEWTRERIPQKVKDLGTRMATYTPGNKLAQTLGAPIWAIQNKAGRMMSSDVDKKVKKTLLETESNLKDSDLTEIISTFVGASRLGNKSKMGAAINAAAEKGKIKDFLENSSIQKILTNEKRLEIVKNAENVDQSKKMIRAMLPDIRQEDFLKDVGFSFKDLAEQTKYQNSLLNKLIDKTKSDQVKFFQLDALNTTEGQNAMHKFWTGKQVAAAGEEFGRPFLEKFQKKIDSLTNPATGGRADWYDVNNKTLGNYLQGNPMSGLRIP